MSDKGKDLANELSRLSDNERKDFIKAFTNQHRTHQQMMFGTILKIVDAVASDDYGTDGRNIESHNRAKLMVNGLKKEVIADLQKNDPYYWTGTKAKDWINGEHYDFTILPLV
jgi:hypothetical protein